MIRRGLVLAMTAWATLGAFASESQAAFHLWDFSEIFSNEDGTIQFIELHAPPTANFENAVANHKLKTSTQTFNVPTNLPAGATGNKFFIFATAGFSALPGAITPNFIIPDGFFDPQGDSLNWSDVDTLSWTAGQLPLDGHLSLLENGTTAVNTPTNFAGDVGEINLAPVVVPGDTNGDQVVDLIDLNNVRNNFGAVGPGVLGDTNNDESVDLSDLNAVRNNFGAAGSASAVPEPASAALLAGCAALLAWRSRQRS